MTKFRYPRLVASLAVLAIGTAMALAVGIGHTWTDALSSEITIILITVGYYFLTGSKGDVGAIYRRRTDERQQHVIMKASRLAMLVMFALTFGIALVMVARNENYWQEDVIGSVGGVSFFLGIMIYGTHEEDAAGTSRGIMASDAVKGIEETDDIAPPM